MYLAEVAGTLGDDPFALEAIEARLATVPGEMAARAALDAALHDLIGKLVGQPTWRLLGLGPVTPPTSYTIGIDTVEGTEDRVGRAVAAGYRRLKVKLGGAEDVARLEAVRRITTSRSASTPTRAGRSTTPASCCPCAAGSRSSSSSSPSRPRTSRAFRPSGTSAAGIPIVIDEGCHTLRDVAAVAAYADGVNLKLAKTGGIREALRMVHAARALGLVVMLGCMIESSNGIAAAAQIASLCDFVDLDGHLLLAQDPFTGLGLADGAVTLSPDPGLGVRPR